MIKIQMNKPNEKNCTKNRSKFISQSKSLKSHGITLMSLTIYLTIMFVILAIVMRFTLYFSKNMGDIADISFETEFEKFNLYMLQETYKTDNGVYKISENKIVFADGNVIEYKKEEENETGEIYYNDIKICEDVDSCTFTTPNNVETGKITIQVDITISGIRKQGINYASFKSKLPNTYQEVEYIESTGTQYIDLGVIPTNNYGAEIEYAYTSTSNNDSAKLFGTRNGSGSTGAFAYITGHSGMLDSTVYFVSHNTTFLTSTNNIAIDLNWHKVQVNINNDKKAYYDDTLVGTGTNTEFTANAELSLFRVYNASFYTDPTKARVKSLRIFNNSDLIRDFIPCYRKSDGEIGLYDIVNDEFYTNSGTGTFLKGPEV